MCHFFIKSPSLLPFNGSHVSVDLFLSIHAIVFYFFVFQVDNEDFFALSSNTKSNDSLNKSDNSIVTPAPRKTFSFTAIKKDKIPPKQNSDLTSFEMNDFWDDDDIPLLDTKLKDNNKSAEIQAKFADEAKKYVAPAVIDPILPEKNANCQKKMQMLIQKKMQTATLSSDLDSDDFVVSKTNKPSFVKENNSVLENKGQEKHNNQQLDKVPRLEDFVSDCPFQV